MSEKDDIDAASEFKTHRKAKAISPDVDMTDDGYKFGPEMEKAYEVQKTPTLTVVENVRTVIATAIQCGRLTGYNPTEEEWYEIKKACDTIDRQDKKLTAKDKALQQAMACSDRKGLCDECREVCKKARRG